MARGTAHYHQHLLPLPLPPSPSPSPSPDSPFYPSLRAAPGGQSLPFPRSRPSPPLRLPLRPSSAILIRLFSPFSGPSPSFRQTQTMRARIPPSPSPLRASPPTSASPSPSTRPPVTTAPSAHPHTLARTPIRAGSRGGGGMGFRVAVPLQSPLPQPNVLPRSGACHTRHCRCSSRLCCRGLSAIANWNVSLSPSTVPHASPNVTRSSPNVTRSSPNVTRLSPNVTHSSSNVTRSSPTAPRSSPTVSRSSPTVPRSSPTVPRSSPTITLVV
ncbi:unnamed protein product [Closterium sp. NIES-54]